MDVLLFVAIDDARQSIHDGVGDDGVVNKRMPIIVRPLTYKDRRLASSEQRTFMRCAASVTNGMFRLLHPAG